MSESTFPGPSLGQAVGQRWRSVVGLTVLAVATFVVFRRLPTGTNLHGQDFSAGDGQTAIQLCDPANPQFIPVSSVRSPVEATLVQNTAKDGSGRIDCVLTLKTVTGKPIGDVDLLISHTEKVHLMVIDPSLSDYRHIHPKPGRGPGEWVFSFTPHKGGNYYIYADFTPAATARPLYASTRLLVPGVTENPVPQFGDVVERGPYRHSLVTEQREFVAGKAINFTYLVERSDGQNLKVHKVMDAFAHLVAFDDQHSGFAHLHPKQLVSNPAEAMEVSKSRLDFTITIPNPGNYVIWAQTVLDGKESFVPFWIKVQP